MGFANKLFIALRIFEVFFSLVALGFGINIALKLRSLSSDIHTVVTFAETTLNGTIPAHDFDVIVEFGSAVEAFFSGPPIRVYILTSVSLWSLCAVVYLLIAQHSTERIGLNKRRIVISLELFTAAAWIAGLVSAVLLVTEYSAVCVPFEYITKIHIFNDFLENYPVLDDILPTCTLDFVATAAAGTCWSLWGITSLMACCTDRHGNCCCGGKRKKGDAEPEIAAYETLVPMQSGGKASQPVFKVRGSSMQSSGKGGGTVDQSPATPAPPYYSPASQSHSPMLQHYSP